LQVYLNGHQLGDGLARTMTLHDTDEPLRLGWLGSFGSFYGGMDEVRIYNRALSQQEVVALYRYDKSRK
ncbi:MAG TPA: LamG-like jellyroll fold domain-containing protein, partial [Armatimonadota bacterium]